MPHDATLSRSAQFAMKKTLTYQHYFNKISWLELLNGERSLTAFHDLAFGGLGARARHRANAGWLYSAASPTHTDACVTAGFIHGGVHEK